MRKKAKARREGTNARRQAKALPGKKYGVVYADPEWKFEVWSEKGKTSASAENHYPCSELEDIKQRDVASIAADDCVLWLWATAPMIEAALAVMKAWGFEYKSQVVWIKDRTGTGYWFLNKHELLLVGVKGKHPRAHAGRSVSVRDRSAAWAPFREAGNLQRRHRRLLSEPSEDRIERAQLSPGVGIRGGSRRLRKRSAALKARNERKEQGI